jgi:hypothetical protein
LKINKKNPNYFIPGFPKITGVSCSLKKLIKKDPKIILANLHSIPLNICLIKPFPFVLKAL